MEVSKRLEGVGEYYFSQKLREIDDMNKAGKNIINLGIGSPDLPPHPDVIKLYRKNLQNLTPMPTRIIKEARFFAMQFQNGIKNGMMLI